MCIGQKYLHLITGLLAAFSFPDDPDFSRVRLSSPTCSYQLLMHHAIELAMAAPVLTNGTQTHTPTWDQIFLLYIEINGDKALISPILSLTML
jgi:hypothetical protein